MRTSQDSNLVASPQVKAPFDIPELKRRLIPFGVYCPSHGITQPEQSKALTTRLHINCFSGRQNFMQFLPLPVPYASAMDLPERVFPVTLISDDGREKPVMFGLTIGQVICLVLLGDQHDPVWQERGIGCSMWSLQRHLNARLLRGRPRAAVLASGPPCDLSACCIPSLISFLFGHVKLYMSQRLDERSCW